MDDNTSRSSPPTHPELSYSTIPLNTPATEIRLLELFPSADFSSPLHCRLYNTPISSPAPFKALSYAWGSDDKTHLIYIDSNTSDGVASVVDVPSSDNGEEAYPNPETTPTKMYIIRITSSLDACLRHLRAMHHRDHPLTKLTLWIDQLCIDQFNSHEKAVQVGLMSQIYSRAEQVLIWLGPAVDGSDEVMDALAELGREFESVGMSLGDANRFYEVVNGLVYGGDGEGGGAGVREGTGTTFGDDKVVDVPGDGDGVEVGSDLGVGVGVADTEALDGVAVACTTNKADTSTERTIMAVIEDGAARLARLWASGELQAFFRRPWFTRVWVVQESCLCADTVFVCGTKPPVSYDNLGAICLCTFQAVREFQRKGGYTPQWAVVSPISTGAEIAGVRMSEDVFRAWGRFLEHIFWSYRIRHGRLQQIMEGEGGVNLFTLLVEMYGDLHSSREAKLHRDRVYALLGVAADVDELEINPDYSSQTGTARILTKVAKAIIRKTKDGFPVELLCYSQFPKTILDNGSNEQLPSWVPDWRSGLQPPFNDLLKEEDDANPEEGNTGTDRDMFVACGPHRSIDMVPSTTAGMLGLRGYLVDTIEEVGCMVSQESSTRPPLHESIEFFEKLNRLWKLSKQKNKPIYKTPARREEALWRVPIGDMAWDDQKDMLQHRAEADLALEYHKWRRTLELYQAIGCDITAPGWRDCVDEDKKKKVTEWAAHGLGADGGRPYDEAMRHGGMWRARKILYLTKKGYMGMGPSDIQPGDVVVVFPGARIPFVLRPTSEDNTFTYLGDAYCDGIMDGEITLREERREFFLV